MPCAAVSACEVNESRCEGWAAIVWKCLILTLLFTPLVCKKEFKRHLKRLRFPHENDKDCECKMLGMPQERCILSWFEDSLIGDA